MIWRKFILVFLFSLTFVFGGWSFGASPSHGDEFIKFGAASPGGSWFQLVGGMSALLTRQIDGLVVSMEPTAGSVDNNRIIRRGGVDIALTHALTAYDNWNGVGLFKGKGAFKDIRMLARVYVSWHHWVALEGSGVKSMSDLAGKRVALGPAGSGSAVNSENILRSLGLWEKITPRHLTFSDAGRALGDGHIDALGLSSAPMASVVTLEATHKIRMIELSEAEIGKVLGDFPAYSKDIMPPKVYKTWDKPYPAVSFYVYLMAHKKLADKWAYEVLRVAFDPKNKKYLARVHRQWTTLAPGLDSMKAMGVPLHPGAVRFWKEKGLEIPAALNPAPGT